MTRGQGFSEAFRVIRRTSAGKKSPVRILHLITTSDVGGAEVMLMRLISALDPGLFLNRVVCMAHRGEIGAQIEAAGVPVSYLNFTRKMISIPGILSWLRIVHRERPEIVQTWMYHANLFGLSAPIASRNARVIWNIQTAGRSREDLKPLTRSVIKACRRLSGFPKAVIINSRKGIEDHLRTGYSRRNLRLIPNGFDLSLYHPAKPEARRRARLALGIFDDTPCVGMFARFHPVKDHACALTAVQSILKGGVKAHFFFAGTGVESSNNVLYRQISIGGFQSSIHLLGYRRDVSQLMPAMDVVLSCSHSEGLSNVIGEAMASGVPCVVTDVGDSSLVVGNTGRTVRPRDPEGLAKALMEILLMPSESRRLLGIKARERIRTHYAIEKVADSYGQLYLNSLMHR